ncbi:hypothetical protein ALC56_08355, partial [Trachymyrmex septentrionalis]
KILGGNIQISGSYFNSSLARIFRIFTLIYYTSQVEGLTDQVRRTMAEKSKVRRLIRGGVKARKITLTNLSCIGRGAGCTISLREEIEVGVKRD